MNRVVLIPLLLLLCPVWALLGQQSGGMKISVQGGEAGQAPKKSNEQGAQPLTNDSIVKLVKAGLSEGTVVNIVNTQPGNYSPGADDIIALKKAGVSEKVITAMLKKSARGPTPARLAPASVAPAGVTESKRRGTGGDKAAEPRAEPSGAVQARGYKDEEGMYRARRADDGEAQYQFDRINEDLIMFVPECTSTDSIFSSPATKLEIDKSLKLDEYEVSRLIGRDEAKAFHKRMVEQGCF